MLVALSGIVVVMAMSVSLALRGALIEECTYWSWVEGYRVVVLLGVVGLLKEA